MRATAYPRTAIALAISAFSALPCAQARAVGHGVPVHPAGIEPTGSSVVLDNLASTVEDIYSSGAIARNRAGQFVAAWTVYPLSSVTSTVYFQLFDASGNPLTPKTSVPATSAWGPAVAINDNGEFVVSWQAGQSGEPTVVYAQKFAADGSPIGSELTVGSYGPHLPYPQEQYLGDGGTSVAMDPDGDFAVAWDDDYQDVRKFGFCSGYINPLCFTSTTQHFATYVRAYGADTAPRTDAIAAYTSPAVQIISGSLGLQHRPGGLHPKPAVAMDGAGNFLVAVDVSLKSTENIYSVRFNADGSGEQQTLVNSFPVSQGTWGVAASMDAAGDAAILWGRLAYSFPDAGYVTHLNVQRYDASGSAQGSAIKVAASSLSGSGIASVDDRAVGLSANGALCASWMTAGSDYAQCYNADNSTRGSTVLLASGINSAHGVGLAQTAMDVDDAPALLWATYDTTALTGVLSAQLFSAP